MNFSKFFLLLIFCSLTFSTSSDVSADKAEPEWSGFGRLAYEIENGFLTIITTEEESDEYYGNSTILKYSRK